jgi:phosphoadenosine phosphosulfate reductase
MLSITDDQSAVVYNETDSQRIAVEHSNQQVAGLQAAERVEWALTHLPGQHVLTSSFGVQAAVSLHMVTSFKPDIPVIFIDTGYLFPETYHFIDALTQRLSLNLQIYRSTVSPAWQEARHGERWAKGLKGIEAYNHENKVEPMERALTDFGVGTWFAGLRRDQSSGRNSIPFLKCSGNRWKVHPIADWTDRDISKYLKQHQLPYHPLWEQGYVSIGDVHTTKSMHEVADVDETRFFGLKRECGLHEIDLSAI